jgi:hypothetical protein
MDVQVQEHVEKVLVLVPVVVVRDAVLDSLVDVKVLVKDGVADVSVDVAVVSVLLPVASAAA